MVAINSPCFERPAKLPRPREVDRPKLEIIAAL
jgi:hypothetical protein